MTGAPSLPDFPPLPGFWDPFLLVSVSWAPTVFAHFIRPPISVSTHAQPGPTCCGCGQRVCSCRYMVSTRV